MVVFSKVDRSKEIKKVKTKDCFKNTSRDNKNFEKSKGKRRKIKLIMKIKMKSRAKDRIKGSKNIILMVK